MNVCELWSACKQSHSFNDLRSLDLDVVATSEARITGKHALASIFEDYDIFSSCGQLEASGGVVVVFWKFLDLQVLVIILDQ